MQPEMGEDDHRATSVGESRDPTGEGERAAAAAAAAVAAAAAAMAAAAGAERANDTTSLGGVAGGAGQVRAGVEFSPGWGFVIFLFFSMFLFRVRSLGASVCRGWLAARGHHLRDGMK